MCKTNSGKIIIYWIVLVMSLPLQSTTTEIDCDDRYSPVRSPTYEEIRDCQDNHNWYNSYDSRYYNRNCHSAISELLDTTCNALLLKSNDFLNIRAKNPKVLLFNYSFIKAIPPRLFEKYASLQKIYINDSHVTEVDLNAFTGLTNLKELYLQNNRITEIGKGTFNSLINLTNLDISNNQIEIIEKKSFHGLTHLEILNVSRNVIPNISDDIFDSNLHSLRVLNLSHNFISTIELIKILPLFSHAKQNFTIELSYNALKSFNFSQLTLNLDTLNLNNNSLETLGDLKKSVVIKYLDVSNNRLSKFNYPPENIIYLNLSGNLLENFNTSFSNGSKIEVLDLGRNLIKSLKSNTFDNMSSLTNLCLKDNQLVDLPIGLFKNLKHLLILNLSGNRFKQFEFGIFSGLSDLLEFDISNNSFSDLNYKTLYSFKNLTVLNIAHNDLVTLNPYDILNHCEKLEMVILNDNPWNCVSLLNFTMILNKNNVTVMEGSNLNLKNHQGHACDDDMMTKNLDKNYNDKTDYHSMKNKVNDLTNFFDFEFSNTSFYHYFENYNNRSQPNFDTFNEYFNKDFKNTSFYKLFNKNISTNFPTGNDESFHNLTNTLNLLNLKLSNLNQSTGLPSLNQINLDKLSQVLSNFTDYFESKFKSSNFYKVFDKNFTNGNELNKPTVDLLNNNLEKLSKSVDAIASIVEKESSFYRAFQTKLENGSFDKFLIKTTFPQTVTSNISYAKLTGASEINQDIAQQIAGLRGSFIAIMAILITLLLIVILLPILKKFANPFSKNSANRNTFESTADLPLV